MKRLPKEECEKENERLRKENERLRAENLLLKRCTLTRDGTISMPHTREA
ncbi:MAG: hypothetical protein MR724_11645 [Prevotella sp.]|nr:hypothetical protein [Prevotella sp.]